LTAAVRKYRSFAGGSANASSRPKGDLQDRSGERAVRGGKRTSAEGAGCAMSGHSPCEEYRRPKVRHRPTLMSARLRFCDLTRPSEYAFAAEIHEKRTAAVDGSRNPHKRDHEFHDTTNVAASGDHSFALFAIFTARGNTRPSAKGPSRRPILSCDRRGASPKTSDHQVYRAPNAPRTPFRLSSAAPTANS
jgi:hypothetical protein